LDAGALGFSHAEVNGLAFPVPLESGPKGEVYYRFYTYGPALDQFVASRLNKGIYPDDYLQANLNNLKTNAELAERYGLTPGLVCFEPRSVPEKLLQRYPMLRGARVDHPIRSFQPRYNLSIGHPVVREHYDEMMENLMKAVPALEYISVWSNDSGAGFEYTSSLYVGRNGGGYVIREWKGDKEIAEAAANNLVRFMHVLRDAGRKVNPKFRTLVRFEPFTAEQDYIWKQLEDGIDVEVSSSDQRLGIVLNIPSTKKYLRFSAWRSSIASIPKKTADARIAAQRLTNGRHFHARRFVESRAAHRHSVSIFGL
jgi:hypothetical protein